MLRNVKKSRSKQRETSPNSHNVGTTVNGGCDRSGSVKEEVPRIRVGGARGQQPKKIIQYPARIGEVTMYAQECKEIPIKTTISSLEKLDKVDRVTFCSKLPIEVISEALLR